MKLALPSWLRRRAIAPEAPDTAVTSVETPPEAPDAAVTPAGTPPEAPDTAVAPVETPAETPLEAQGSTVPVARKGRRGRWLLAIALVVTAIAWGVSFYWSREPGVLSVVAETPEGERAAVGYSTVHTLIDVIDWLLEKPGGYLSNDVAPPAVWLDNMPSFELGVLTQCRDLARALRNYHSRSQSQSIEDEDLAAAESALSTDRESWLFPMAEVRYREAARSLRRYEARLTEANLADAQFHARADNFNEWLAVVELRLDSLSQRLSASAGQTRLDTDPGGAPSAEASREAAGDGIVKTPWLEVDDVFYEARGSAWALLLFLRAAQFDFERTLENQDAVVRLRQIIRELEEGLAPVRSPIILNGQGFSMLPNHSLVLASYLARAHSGVADLRSLLEQG